MKDTDMMDNILNESSLIYKVKLDKKVILQKKISRASILLAKQAGDPLYDKFKLWLMNFKNVRKAIYKKYGSKAKSLVFKMKNKSATPPPPKDKK